MVSQNISLEPMARALAMHSRAIMPPPTTTKIGRSAASSLRAWAYSRRLAALRPARTQAAERIDEYHEGGLAGEGIKRLLVTALALPCSQSFANGLCVEALDLLEDLQGGLARSTASIPSLISFNEILLLNRCFLRSAGLQSREKFYVPDRCT